MDVITQFYAEVRIHQMLSFLTNCHANNYDLIPFIDANILVCTTLKNLIPKKATKSIQRVVKNIQSHDLTEKRSTSQITLTGIKIYSVYLNDFLNPNRTDTDIKKRSLILEIASEMAKKKKKQ